MLTAIVAIASVLGTLLGMLFWYLKRRAKREWERNNEKLRKALADNDLDTASDLLRKRVRGDDSPKK